MHRKLLTVFTVLLLFSCVSSSLTTVNGSEETFQERGLTILSDVVGLDLTKYETNTTEYPPLDIFPFNLNGPTGKVDYRLNSNTGNLRIFFTFVNGKLQMIHTLDNYGTPHLTQPATTSTLKMAKTFLSNYQTYTSDPLFRELKDTLNQATDNQNATITTTNATLEITHSTEIKETTYKWTYTINEAKAPNKFIALSFRNNFLFAFVDKWQFYPIGNTTINLSEEEAIQIALETAATHQWSLTLDEGALEPENLNTENIRWTSLYFDDSQEAITARSENPSTLYPVWAIGIALNRWYGNLYGITVEIWADTKEVKATQEAWSMMTPNYTPNPETLNTPKPTTENTNDTLNSQETLATPQTNQAPTTEILVVTVAAVALIGSLMWVHTKNVHKQPSNSRK